MRNLGKYGVIALLATLISGCSMFSSSPSPQPRSSGLFNKCTWDPESCRYEGSYEPGEREYAEDEARRLNQASLDRLRRQGGR